MDVPPECAGHTHDHEHQQDDLGLSLRPLIDFDGVICNNEEVAGSGRAVLKLHEERCTAQPSLLSPPDDNDPELLLHIPFTEAVTVHSIAVRSITDNNHNNNTAAPRTIKLFTNRDTFDFEMAREAPPDATIILLPPEHFAEGTIDYPLRPAGRFQNISSLQLFFVDNYSVPPPQLQQAQAQQGQQAPLPPRRGNSDDGMDEDNDIAATEITFIGLKGQGTKMRRVAVETVYESQAMPEDHQQPSGENTAGHFVD